MRKSSTLDCEHKLGDHHGESSHDEETLYPIPPLLSVIPPLLFVLLLVVIDLAVHVDGDPWASCAATSWGSQVSMTGGAQTDKVQHEADAPPSRHLNGEV